MGKIAYLFVLITLGWLNVFAEDLPKKAAENPLDFALHMAVKENDTRRAEALAGAFFDVGRYDDAVRAIELDDSEYSKINWLVYRAQILDERRNSAKAGEYVDKALAFLKTEDVTADKGVTVALAGLLIKLNRNEEAARLADLSDNRTFALIGIAREFLKANKSAEALKLLPPLSELEQDDDKAAVIELFARLRQTEKAALLLAEFEPTAFVNTPVYHNQRFILFPLINANLALKQVDHAVELWEQYGEKDDGYGWIKLIDALVEFDQRERAHVYLAQIAADPEIQKSDGSDIVRIYLKLGDAEKALNLAKTISDEFDSHEQQIGLMHVTDYFIDNAKPGAAEVLDFAFRRASRVVFEHEDMQSNGASSGTRKRIYLNNIYRRYMKIGLFPKALAAINAVDSEHWIAKEFVMESLYAFLKERAKNQPRQATENLLKQMQSSFTERNKDYYLPQIKLFNAEIYALLGEKTKASDFLAKGITEGKESCCYEFGFLLSAGKIFEKYKLKAGTNLKKALRDFTKPVGE